MSSSKRKLVETALNRRVRSRRDDSDDEAPESPVQSEVENDNQPSASVTDDESDEAKSDDEPALASTSTISFGALAKAQASLSAKPKRRRGVPTDHDGAEGDRWEDTEALERQRGRKDRRDFGRSSKHAPTEVSSKKAVSRKREVVPVAKRAHRDPRFDGLSGKLDEDKARRAYAFLDEYRDDEMQDLRQRIATTKQLAEKESLKRALLAMESRKKAQQKKDMEQDILNRHKQEQKERVMEGKMPFYLKSAELKKRMLVEQFKGLKGKQVEHAIERRRKKLTAKERKHMPTARRSVD